MVDGRSRQRVESLTHQGQGSHWFACYHPQLLFLHWTCGQSPTMITWMYRLNGVNSRLNQCMSQSCCRESFGWLCVDALTAALAGARMCMHAWRRRAMTRVGGLQKRGSAHLQPSQPAALAAWQKRSQSTRGRDKSLASLQSCAARAPHPIICSDLSVVQAAARTRRRPWPSSAASRRSRG